MAKSYQIHLYTRNDHCFITTASTVTEALKLKKIKDKQYMKEYQDDEDWDEAIIEVIPTA